MKNLENYNHYVQSLEKIADGGMFFHRIENYIYITDSTRKLLGVWDLMVGEAQKTSSL